MFFVQDMRKGRWMEGRKACQSFLIFVEMYCQTNVLIRIQNMNYEKDNKKMSETKKGALTK